MPSAGPVSEEVLTTLEDVRRRSFRRLEGMGDEEYLWQPVDGCLSVRPGPDGSFRADARPSHDVQPAPFSTIAWRTWHIGADCLRGFDRFFEGGLARPDDWQAWPGTADAGIAEVAADWARFRGRIEALGDERLIAPMGPVAGHFAHETYLNLALHAIDEVAHHTAELAMLRDLYARAFVSA